MASTPDEARDFVERYGWTWPSILDRERERARSVGAEYQPHVIVVNADGEVVGSFEGGGEDADWEALAALVS